MLIKLPLRVHTPTAAAETVVTALADLQIQHQQRITGLCTAVNSSLAAREQQLQGLKHRLRQLRLDRQVEQERDKLSWKHRQLLQVTTGKLQQAGQHLEMLRQKLDSIDPKSVLQRGYAVVITENGVIPRSVSELTIGENLVIQLAQGKVTVKVIEVTEG